MNLLTLNWDTGAERFDINERPADRLSWLENAVLISLFTDARAAADDEIADGSTDRRGFWGDLFLEQGQSLGSRLWLLRREKTTPATVERCRVYCIEALEWLVNDGHIAGLLVTTERQGLARIAIAIDLQMPDGTSHRLFTEHRNAV